MEAQGFNLDENSNINFFGDEYKLAAKDSNAIVVMTEFD